MRGYFVCVMLAILPTIAWAASDRIPTLDVRPVCRGIASQSANPGVGQRNQTETFQQKPKVQGYIPNVRGAVTSVP
jgi:hypothetical protein